MGQGTDGQLYYGVVFEEGFEFPWSGDEFDDDIEQWWGSDQDFGENPFTPQGSYKEGWSGGDPRTKAYFAKRRAWLAENPPPFQEVNVCSDSYPIYMLALPGYGGKASRGCPEKVPPEDLFVPSSDIDQFKAALTKLGIKFKAEDLGWYLSSYWDL